MKHFNHVHGHAHAGNKTYTVWFSMKARCYNKKHKSYHRYGGRGIFVCDEWHDFVNFLADMGEVKPGLSLGRIDNDGPYAKWNCRWETVQQQQNNRVSSRFIEAFGKKQTISQWSREVGIRHDTILWRIKLGWSVEDVLSKPVRRKRKEQGKLTVYFGTPPKAK